MVRESHKRISVDTREVFRVSGHERPRDRLKSLKGIWGMLIQVFASGDLADEDGAGSGPGSAIPPRAKTLSKRGRPGSLVTRARCDGNHPGIRRSFDGQRL
jgi:hypothetical protein